MGYKATALEGGVSGQVKNLIFASNGYKPEIVLVDALNNDIRITKNEKYCLIYDRTIPSEGLSWIALMEWWQNLPDKTEQTLLERLQQSLASPPEHLLFNSYFKTMSSVLEHNLPALIPQVYLHYDPYTVRERNGQIELPRQRMDFLLLLPHSRRVVLEVDGKQHYADGDTASPQLYSEMVAADRKLKLSGYEVYRFGGYELRDNGGQDNGGQQVVQNFFNQLFIRHGLLPDKTV